MSSRVSAVTADGWIMRSCLALCLAGALSAQESPPGERGPGGIVAIVNQDVITRAEFDRQVTIYMEDEARRTGRPLTDYERGRRQFEKAVLDSLVEQLLLLQEAKRNNIAVSEEEIDAEINHEVEKKFRPAFNVQDSNELYKVLKENFGVSREEYRRQRRESMLVNRLLWTKHFREPFISPVEIRQYYQQHPEEFATPAQLVFRMITVDNVEAAPRILEALDAALETKPFADVAREYAEEQGRDVVLWRKDVDEIKEWQVPLPEVLSKMKPGDVQKRVRTVNGWRYFEMVEVKQGKRKSFVDAQNRIREAIRQEHRVREKEKLVGRLKKGAHIQIFLPPLPVASPRPAPTKAAPTGPAPAPAAQAEQPAGKIRDVSPDPTKPKGDASAGKSAPPAEEKPAGQ